MSDTPMRFDGIFNMTVGDADTKALHCCIKAMLKKKRVSGSLATESRPRTGPRPSLGNPAERNFTVKALNEKQPSDITGIKRRTARRAGIAQTGTWSTNHR